MSGRLCAPVCPWRSLTSTVRSAIIMDAIMRRINFLPELKLRPTASPVSLVWAATVLRFEHRENLRLIHEYFSKSRGAGSEQRARGVGTFVSARVGGPDDLLHPRLAQAGGLDCLSSAWHAV